MKLLLILGVIAIVLVTHPALAAALLGLIGTVLAAAAAQPTVWAFVAGLLAWPRIADRARRWTP